MKIGFCFLIYDKINLEELWELFFKDVDPNKYNIYVHYKDNKILKYFEQYKLHQSECIELRQNFKLIDVKTSKFHAKFS